MDVFRKTAAAACLALVAVPLAAQTEVTTPALSRAERLETILARFDQAQRSIRTLTADFTEHKELALLADPIQSEGQFYYVAPHQAKWEYVAPDHRVILISNNTLMQYFPADKVLERKDLRTANTNRVFKLFGMGQTSRELRDFYHIELGEAEPEAKTYQLVLTPHRRRVEKRISRVLLWVGDQDFLPRAMRYEEADGDFTQWTFDNVRLNADIAHKTFHLEVPDDVEIRDEFKLFSSDAKGGAP